VVGKRTEAALCRPQTNWWDFCTSWNSLGTFWIRREPFHWLVMQWTGAAYILLDRRRFGTYNYAFGDMYNKNKRLCSPPWRLSSSFASCTGAWRSWGANTWLGTCHFPSKTSGWQLINEAERLQDSPKRNSLGHKFTLLSPETGNCAPICLRPRLRLWMLLQGKDTKARRNS